MQFKDIEGQHLLANRLTEIIDSGRISHAQMFLGPTASGSLALAIAYAQYLGCENRQHYPEGSVLRADSCGVCPHCRKYAELVHPDLHLVFPTTTTATVTSKPCADDFQEEFRAFMQDYCVSLFRLGGETSAQAFKALSEHLLTYCKDEPLYVNNLGSYHLVRREYKQARKYYERVLKKNPSDETALRNCLLMARAMKDPKLEKKYQAMIDRK